MSYTSVIALKNQGLGQSKDVELHIHSPGGISFYYDSINKSTNPKHDSMEIVNDHECYYKWNYVNPGEIVNIKLHFSADSELGSYISLIDVSVRENKG